MSLRRPRDLLTHTAAQCPLQGESLCRDSCLVPSSASHGMRQSIQAGEDRLSPWAACPGSGTVDLSVL